MLQETDPAIGLDGRGKGRKQRGFWNSLWKSWRFFLEGGKIVKLSPATCLKKLVSGEMLGKFRILFYFCILSVIREWDQFRQTGDLSENREGGGGKIILQREVLSVCLSVCLCSEI